MVNLENHRSEASFSILNKLVIFGILVLIAGFILGGATFYITKAPIHELTGSIQALKKYYENFMGFDGCNVNPYYYCTISYNSKADKKEKELSYLSTHFNSTILKIGDSVQLFDTNIAMMQQMGKELASNITETASTINRIQTLARTESVTETMEN